MAELTEDQNRRLQELETRAVFPASEVERLTRRAQFLWRAKRDGIGAEIGVFRGYFTEVLCAQLRPRKLYLIDPWTKIGTYFPYQSAYDSHGALSTEEAREEAQLRATRAATGKIHFIEDHYPDCASQIKEPLDWAYLDASHSYDETLAELRALARQMQPDGLIYGDDWSPRPEAKHHGVFRAVQQFTRESKWKLVACGPASQWAIAHYPDD